MDIVADTTMADRQVRESLQNEIVALEARIQDLTQKAQTVNKILKKKYTKSLEEVTALLAAKKSALDALQ